MKHVVKGVVTTVHLRHGKKESTIAYHGPNWKAHPPFNQYMIVRGDWGVGTRVTITLVSANRS